MQQQQQQQHIPMSSVTAVEGVEARILIPYNEFLHYKRLEKEMYPSHDAADDDDDNNHPDDDNDEAMTERPMVGSSLQQQPPQQQQAMSAHSLAQLKHRQGMLASENQRLEQLDMERQLEKQTGGGMQPPHQHMYAPYPPAATRGRGGGGRGGGGRKKRAPAAAVTATGLNKLYYIG